MAQDATVADALRDATRIGSGVVIDTSGLVLTNAHVVDAGCPIKPEKPEAVRYCTIATFDHKKAFKVRVEKVDQEFDIALLKVIEPGSATFARLPIADSLLESRLEGREVFIVGRPFGRANTAVSGIISNSPDRDEVCKPNQIRAVVPIAPGNSGGAMIDLGTGVIVGLVTSVSVTEDVERTPKGVVRKTAFMLNMACALHPKHIRSFLGS